MSLSKWCLLALLLAVAVAHPTTTPSSEKCDDDKKQDDEAATTATTTEATTTTTTEAYSDIKSMHYELCIYAKLLFGNSLSFFCKKMYVLKTCIFRPKFEFRC